MHNVEQFLLLLYCYFSYKCKSYSVTVTKNAEGRCTRWT